VTTGRLKPRFGVSAGEYAGRWFDENFKKPEDDEHASPPRIWDKARAEAILARCAGKPAKVEEESKPSSQLSPLLFDLTSLQREANGRFGFSARTTLQLAQALYEKHKVLTYPRTDARCLPEDYVATVPGILGALPDAYAAVSPLRSSSAAGSSPTSAFSTTPRSRTTLPSCPPAPSQRA
jgi:DNA topoisomerase III